MSDILLFGATGYTGRLTAAALADAGASFAIVGRDRSKLEDLSAQTGNPEIHVASVGDVDALTRALSGCKVLITCVGPFVQLGDTAIEAALRAGVHYIDSTGEGVFIDRLLDERNGDARAANLTIAPALGFDEVPGDVACTLAVEGMDHPEVIVTYAVPRKGSAGTVRSATGIMASSGPWIDDGVRRKIKVGAEERWSPMPAPLGPRRAQAFPFALTRLAPLHIDAQTFKTFITAGNLERYAMRVGAPLLGLVSKGPVTRAIDLFTRLLPEGPDEEERDKGRWTILAEARSGDRWRNVVATGTDVYGLTARTLARAAITMSTPGYERSGVLSPVQAVGLDPLREELTSAGVEFQIHEPSG
jgi:short subunit dehydrogenase-like uncharacterized protein